MHDMELKKIADEAAMIVRGYAFLNKDGHISVINLNHPSSAMVMTKAGKLLESNMDEIEQTIVMKIWENDAEYMEAGNA